MNQRHLYLFTLEVAPLHVGKAYNPLPSHLTLMSRFWSELSPSELSQIVKPLFRQTPPLELYFGKTITLGPKHTVVHMIEHTQAMQRLHTQLYGLLSSIPVTYTAPQYVDDGYKPHVSMRAADSFVTGHHQMTATAYLIEVTKQDSADLRHICAKFDLEDSAAHSA